jgi:hypothetical protein
VGVGDNVRVGMGVNVSVGVEVGTGAKVEQDIVRKAKKTTTAALRSMIPSMLNGSKNKPDGKTPSGFDSTSTSLPRPLQLFLSRL